MRSLEGRTALVVGGGTAIGRAIALALSARGVRIVVTGRDEKALGQTVGEIVHGGGKARHVTGEGRASSVLDAAIARAKEVFGQVDIVVDAAQTDVDYTFASTTPHLRSAGRVLLVTATKTHEAMAVAVRERASALFAHGVTCNAIVVERAGAVAQPDAAPVDADDVDEVASDVGELAVFLCMPAADRITGQSIAVQPGARSAAKAHAP
jgi:NAD(P)-dependent dehydrogenase (short-subunit alcohol dehydrogenase family)